MESTSLHALNASHSPMNALHQNPFMGSLGFSAMPSTPDGVGLSGDRITEVTGMPLLSQYGLDANAVLPSLAFYPLSDQFESAVHPGVDPLAGVTEVNGIGSTVSSPGDFGLDAGSYGIDINSSFYQPDGNKFVRGNNDPTFWCTEFAYGRALEKGLIQDDVGLGAALNGNAGDWDNVISNSAYADRLDRTAAVNSIVVWEGNEVFRWTDENGGEFWSTTGAPGHVGFVEQVNADGSFVISEGNANGQPLNIRTIEAGTPENVAAQFIHL
jgi:surface antigen